jgi:hypothetical protein
LREDGRVTRILHGFLVLDLVSADEITAHFESAR